MTKLIDDATLARLAELEKKAMPWVIFVPELPAELETKWVADMAKFKDLLGEP